MAISNLVSRWLDEIADKRVFLDRDVLECGPQDISCDASAIEKISKKWKSEVTDAKSLYYAFGATGYRSIDLFDSRAEYRWDLNRRVDSFEKFGVVTNFGTAEHVFNIGMFFENVHRLTADGGYMLHILPVMGDVGHGFYNIHPVFYDRLAKANGYEIVDFRYVDNIGNRNEGANGAPFLDVVPSMEYLKIRRACDERMKSNKGSEVVFDYIFVAMRKAEHGGFVVPSQY